MPAFQLFRCRITLPAQGDLLRETPNRSQLIVRALEERPAAELRQGYTWHIGNLEQLGESGRYFAFGRTTATSIELYDETIGNFVEVSFDAAPYTHVVVDTETQLVAIASKSKLAPSIPGISRQLTKLLNRTSVAREYSARFEIAEVKDPDDLIRHLHESYAVRRFRLTFEKPNPFDANEFVQKPLERFLQEANGRAGKTEVAGENLDPDVLEELVRSAAASGNDAVAFVAPDEDSRPIKKQLRGNSVVVQEGEPLTEEEKTALLDRIRRIYAQVRRAETQEREH